MVAPGDGHVVDDPRMHVALFDPVAEEDNLVPVFVLGQVVFLLASFHDGHVLVELHLEQGK